jgi:hypothetical protein
VFALKGMEDRLRPYVGRQVRISGEAPEQDLTVVREETPPAPAAPPQSAPAPGGTGPTVSTTEATRIRTTELQVRAVTPLEASCTAPQ